MVWNDYQINLLIEERRSRNEEYWNITGNSRTSFWDSVASKINIEFQCSYTGQQCKEKFQNLVREHMVREKITDLFFKNNIYRFLQLGNTIVCK